MNNFSDTYDTSGNQARDRMLGAFLAIGVGLVILFATGFVQIDAIHNAAHDGRHVFSFPCH